MNEEEFKNPLCNPKLVIEFREILLPLNIKSIPLRIGFTFSLVNDLLVDNPLT